MKSTNHLKIESAHHFCEIVVKEFRAKQEIAFTKPSYPSFQVDLSHKEMAQVVDLFDPVVLSTLCGTVFGDSSLKIQKGYANARLSYRHSSRQTDWFMWKTLYAFGEFTNEEGIQFQLPDGYQAKASVSDGECLGKWKISTRVDEKLTRLQEKIAPNNVKKIQRFWLNHMNNYFLMTLWLDDGSLTGDLGSQGIIATGEMPLDQVKILAQYFKTVWKINCSGTELQSQKMKNGRFATRLYISDQKSLQEFLKIIAPIIPVKSMLYKVCFFPNTVSDQQRWVSQLKSIIRPEWHDEIDKIYSYKKLQFLSKKA